MGSVSTKEARGAIGSVGGAGRLQNGAAIRLFSKEFRVYASVAVGGGGHALTGPTVAHQETYNFLYFQTKALYEY